jgi:uncharacterized phage protein gp47/JayE
VANYKTHDVILTGMKTHMRSLKPGINLTADSDAVIRMSTVAGVAEGLYAEMRAVFLDIWPLTSREEALRRHQDDNRLPDIGAAKWSGTLRVVGTDGSVVSVNDILIAESGERSYLVTVGGTIAGGVVTVTAEAEQAGTTGNLDDADILTFEAPPPGIQDSAVVESTITQGSNEETLTELRERIVSHELQEPSGGNATDYEREGLAASSDVLSSVINRFKPRGAGTLDLYITAGTTNIDAAVDAGDPVLRIPSAGLITTVQDHIDSLLVTTDDVLVPTPTELNVDVPVFVEVLPGYVIGGGGANDVTPIIEAIVQKYLYKLLPTQAGPVKVRISELEALLDSQIGVTISDRKVSDLGAGQTNLELAWGQLAAPGVITVSAFA